LTFKIGISDRILTDVASYLLGQFEIITQQQICLKYLGWCQMARVEVQAGICGFKSNILITAEDEDIVHIKFSTTCPNMKPLEKELIKADAMKECFSKVGESEIYQTCRKYCRHSACPIPMAIIKGIEVASRLALPKNVEVRIFKE
jgi:hypothetical protein